MDSGPNPTIIAIPAKTQGIISCISNAYNMQRVTLSWDNAEIVFTGNGEDKPMLLPNGDDSFLLPFAPSSYNIQALFEFAEEPFEKFSTVDSVQQPIITQKAMFTTIEIMSEDSTDNDNNDSYLSLFLVTAGQSSSSPQKSQVVNTITDDRPQMEAHCKTYYTDPSYYGDEHYLNIPVPNPASSPNKWTLINDYKYSSTSWTLQDAYIGFHTGPLGGNIIINLVLVNELDINFYGCQLLLSARDSYWVSFPTGNRRLDWEAVLAGSNCTMKISKVTP
ncbi:hypothetical protein [Chitinophaga nivalis]|uniref:Uncharacterized protein n=1 Tax=Chitinophaga nivalis TaxID=2991709 RepID=A0ABT3IT51_9BACT|nr:hypothetical protein [Chitinophaga nivalis]MCW3463152.1 hypothetical protein [Chitinophaga nivalis]MCW3487158.1 hypothetical protein [Chitinophaga nivalis]